MFDYWSIDKMTLRKLFLLPVASALAFVTSDFAIAQSAIEEKSATEFVEKFHASMKSGDSKSVLSALADDAIIFESGYAESKSEYAASHLAADISFAATTKRVAKRTTTNCVKSMCIVMQQSETNGTYKGKPVKSIGVETSVLQGDEGTWKISHLHWSSHK
ncbi:MAG: nuclear transport factor 2 family protein [Rhodocyclaceae bacterium]|nr:nuclear transport factor 2 family protein [Rhodocyclaceae bacterium]MBP6278583.1 nuclear transport factor 2 family protein [Rhodocyclaceae bacterium]